MAAGQFRNTVWDPMLIISQIIGVQSVFYATYGMLSFLICYVAGRPISVALLFDSSGSAFVTVEGKLQLSTFLLNSIACAIAIWFIVQRAKQCLDFTVTAHFFHFIMCCSIIGFPSSALWWVMIVVSITITSVLSEFLCMRYEMKAIPVTVSGIS